MRTTEKILTVVALMFITTHSNAQHKKENAFGEFARLREIYKHLPLQLDIHLQNAADPVTGAEDTMQADMTVYYGKPDFYMQAEGLEEIMNDSLIVMVNKQTKQILLYPNAGQLNNSLPVLLPDSSLEFYKKYYTSDVKDVGQDAKEIELTSKGTVYGTNFPKEIVTITYHSTSYEFIELDQKKWKLFPINAGVYSKLVNNETYKDKLVSAKTEKGTIFFMVKELMTSYRFKTIRYDIQEPPAKQEDRITKAGNGNYIPAAGFEEYVLSKEF